MLDALWDLVWAGEVSNDTFAPLRALRWPAAVAAADARRTPGTGRRRGWDRPEAAGRWSLVAEALRSLGIAAAMAGRPRATTQRAALAATCWSATAS